MTNKETNTRVATNININSRRFLDNLVVSVEVYSFCMNISKNPRVTGQIIKRLSRTGIDE